MSETAEKFDAWALVEVMGHQRYAGRVTEATARRMAAQYDNAPVVVFDGRPPQPALPRGVYDDEDEDDDDQDSEIY